MSTGAVWFWMVWPRKAEWKEETKINEVNKIREIPKPPTALFLLEVSRTSCLAVGSNGKSRVRHKHELVITCEHWQLCMVMVLPCVANAALRLTALWSPCDAQVHWQELPQVDDSWLKPGLSCPCSAVHAVHAVHAAQTISNGLNLRDLCVCLCACVGRRSAPHLGCKWIHAKLLIVTRHEWDASWISLMK